MTQFATRRILIGALSSTILALGAVPALAQDAPPPAAAPTATDATAVNPNEIIVTARRRNETLQTTPVAITAINAAMLANKATVNIGDLQGAAPNLLITQQNSGGQAANLSIRGLTYADIEKSQEPTVGVVVDGVFIGTNTGQLLDFFDIEQIEVLRGPQGTLFGRNTIGGVISIRRTKPTMHSGIKAEGTYSSYNSWATRGVVNVGDGESFGVKGFYFHNQSDGYYRNAITGKRAGGSNNENFGASVILKPAGSGFEALLTLEKQDQTFDVTNSNLANSSELFCLFEPARECNRNNTSDLYTVFTSPAKSTYSAPSATLELNYQAGGVKLTSITGYRKSKEFQTQDFDSSSTDLYYTLRQQNYHQFSQELRAAGNQTITSNVGSANIKGLEIDASLRPTQGLRLTATMGLLRSKFKNFIAGNTLTVFDPLAPTVPIPVIRPFDYSRNNPIYSPKFSASAGAEYKVPTAFGSVVGSVGYRYIGAYDQQISLGPLTGNTGFVSNNGNVIVNGNDARVRSDKQGLLDASLTANFKLSNANAYLTVFGRNLANDRGTSAAFTVAGLWSFASAREPRTVGVTLGIKY